MNDYRALLEELIEATDFYYDCREIEGDLADDHPATARYHAAYAAAKAAV